MARSIRIFAGKRRKKDLIINTIQCGEMAETKPIWQEIAKMSEGSYVGISQSGNVAVIATPLDKELSRLNERIGPTLNSIWRQQTAGGSSCEICNGGQCSRCRNGRSTHLQQQDRQSSAGPR